MGESYRLKNILAVPLAEKADRSLFSYFTKAMRFIGSGVTGEKDVK